MPNPTKAQRALMQQLDNGYEIEAIASSLGKSVLAVRRQVARIRRRVQADHIQPTALPIEAAACAPRVYLAGFDVFRLDAVDHGVYLKALCRAHGFSGVYPLDGEVPSHLSPNEKAAWIFRANTEAIRSADVIMANLNDFRGPGEPDSGTAFEIGFATALGKPVWAYRADTKELVDQASACIDRGSALPLCARGYLVEDFGLSVNLMLANLVRLVVGGPVDCLFEMKKVGVDGCPRC